MKFIPCAFLLSLFVFPVITNNNAQAEIYLFKIIEGQVDTTTLFCETRPDCPVVTSSLAGSFSADIQDGTIVFSNARVTVKPKTGFELPENPDIDSNGTTRSIELSFDGQWLEVSGMEDNSAFDGPLYEYRFAAETTGPAGFDATGYYQARRDFRKCVWPMCGGMFLSAVNRPFTRCADGTRAKECYVAALDWTSLGFDPMAQETGVITSAAYVFQGSIEPRVYDDFGNLGVFVGGKAFRPVSDNEPRGLFVGLHINDIVCITWPCASADEYMLNRNRSMSIAGIDLNEAGASAEDRQFAQDLLNEGEVLIAAGSNRWIKGPAGYGLSFKANQIYLPIQPANSCDEGYEYQDGRCLTPHGCEAPLIELKSYIGIAQPDTGEGIIRYDCVERCDPPQTTYVGPARCEAYLP